jgi:dihydroneopterin aldolase
LTSPAHLTLAAKAPALKIERTVVFMRGLTVQAQIGIYPHEYGRTQPLVIDAEAVVEPRQVHSVKDTVNYESLAAKARQLADSGHIDLVETFAERFAAACLDNPLIQRITVRVEKPEALGDAARVGVELIVTKA